MNGLFITGTDTNVGKTYIACLIARDLKSRGINVIPRKPVESGCSLVDDILHPEDAALLLKASQSTSSLDEVCPYRFSAPISPARAAKLTSQKVQLKDLVRTCTYNSADQSFDSDNGFLLTEGAGGFYSPLCEDGLNADLAEELKLPVLLVANDQLGCINHILLSLEAIARRNLSVAAVILNQNTEQMDNSETNNFEDLQEIIDHTVICIDHNAASLPEELMSNLIF